MEDIHGYQIEELLPIVAELAGKYNSYENTSMTYEKAQQLMEAVLYCIAETHAPGERALRNTELSAKEAYQTGLKIVENKVRGLRETFNELMQHFRSYGNRCLDDTVRGGIPEFLKWYDPKFCPQNTILTLDYPVLKDLSIRSGIDRIEAYVSCICLEQRFLALFPENYVRGVLEACSPLGSEEIHNLCSEVWQNVIGHVLLKKTFDDSAFTAEECSVIAEQLLKMEEQDLKEGITKLAAGLLRACPEREELLHYFAGELTGIAARMFQAVRHGTLSHLFV